MDMAPADSPNRVTRPGSPPNAPTFLCTHSMPSRWSYIRYTRCQIETCSQFRRAWRQLRIHGQLSEQTRARCWDRMPPGPPKEWYLARPFVTRHTTPTGAQLPADQATPQEDHRSAGQGSSPTAPLWVQQRCHLVLATALTAETRRHTRVASSASKQSRALRLITDLRSPLPSNSWPRLNNMRQEEAQQGTGHVELHEWPSCMVSEIPHLQAVVPEHVVLIGHHPPQRAQAVVDRHHQNI